MFGQSIRSPKQKNSLRPESTESQRTVPVGCASSSRDDQATTCVQCAHLVAFRGIIDKHCGHSLVTAVGGLLKRLICRMATKIMKAMITKSTMLCRKLP